MAREKIEAEVEFRPKGLAELKGKWADFAGDLLEPVVLLAAGATKAQAAWAGFRGIMENRVLGPLGLVAGTRCASPFFRVQHRQMASQLSAHGHLPAVTRGGARFRIDKRRVVCWIGFDERPTLAQDRLPCPFVGRWQFRQRLLAPHADAGPPADGTDHRA